MQQLTAESPEECLHGTASCLSVLSRQGCMYSKVWQCNAAQHQYGDREAPKLADLLLQAPLSLQSCSLQMAYSFFASTVGSILLVSANVHLSPNSLNTPALSACWWGFVFLFFFLSWLCLGLGYNASWVVTLVSLCLWTLADHVLLQDWIAAMHLGWSTYCLHWHQQE